MSRDSMFRRTDAIAPAPRASGVRAAGPRVAAAQAARHGPARAIELDTRRSRSAPTLALTLRLTLAILLALGSSVALAQGARPAAGDQPVSSQVVPAEKTPADMNNRTTSMMAQGLFDGDRLTADAQARLTDFIIDSVGRQVEIALIIPRGPWVVEGGVEDERSLTPARLNAIRSFLAQRGIDRDRIVVESRIDEKLPEPRLDVQVITREPRD